MNIRTDSVRTLGQALAGVTVAGLVGNALAYLLLLAAARLLAPSQFSVLVTMLNILLIASVGVLALQTMTARRVSAGQPMTTLTATIVVAVLGTVAAVVLAPAAESFLHLPDLTGPLLIAVSLPGAGLQGWCQGVLQGEERFTPLAAVTLVGMVGRSGTGLVGLIASRSAVDTLAWIAVGTTVGAVVSAYPLRAELAGALGWHDARDVLSECAHATHAYGVFLLLAATDLLLARHVLVGDSSAVYAAGSVLTRIALWLPQSVASVLFASLTRPEAQRALYVRAISGLIGLGGLEVAGSAVLRGLVTNIVGGGKYPQLAPHIWLFALLGALLSIIQFTLVARLAARSIGIVVTLWTTVIAECVVVLGQHLASVREVVVAVVLICGVATAIEVGLRSRR